MRKLLLVLLLCSVGLAQPSEIKPIMGADELDGDNPITKGVVAWYWLNEGGGTRVNDLSGYNHPGTITGATWTSGPFGPCLSFDASGDYVTIGTFANFFPVNTANAWAVSVWVLWDGVSYSKYFLGGVGTGGRTFAFGNNNLANNGEFVALIRETDDTSTAVDADSLDPTANTWYHLVWTTDGATCSVYVNGQRSAADDASHTGLYNLSGTVYIGQASATTVWGGKIDNVAIYNRALTAAEIQQLYREPFGMVQQDRPELYVTAGAPPATTYRRRVIISQIQMREAVHAAMPAIIPIGVIGTMVWASRKRKAG